MLHPKYRGKKLSSKQVDDAQELLMEDNRALVTDLLKFFAGDLELLKTLAFPATC